MIFVMSQAIRPRRIAAQESVGFSQPKRALISSGHQSMRNLGERKELPNLRELPSRRHPIAKFIFGQRRILFSVGRYQRADNQEFFLGE
jgi:hypothetical protein